VIYPISEILEKLEAFYGRQKPCWPADPYLFLVWWYCGYPASDATCSRGWESLRKSVGVQPEELLAAPVARMAKALAVGGMMPEQRAMRLKELAGRVQNEFGGDLSRGMLGPLTQVRKMLKKFPSIADPGADRIFLFAGVAPVAAVPSNCVHVLVRIRRGPEGKNYGADYREAQAAIEAEIPANIDARQRAYLLLKTHGQETCKRTNPKCKICPVNSACAFFGRA
jgi:endonuclease III